MTLILLIAVLSAQPPVTIYIGPQIRDGLIDIDEGVAKSIDDIKAEVAKLRQFRIVPSPGDAVIAFYVIERRQHDSGDSIGLPIGAGMTINASTKRFTIESILKAGAYERRFVSDDNQRGTWKEAAKHAARDLLVWTQANQSALQKPQ